MKRIFIVKILLENQTEEWGMYKPNTEILIPVFTNSAYNAHRKVSNNLWGSEYPLYSIISVEKCDEFLFSPLMGNQIEYLEGEVSRLKRTINRKF